MVERHAVVPDLTQRNAIGHHHHVLPFIGEFRRAPVSMWSRGRESGKGRKRSAQPLSIHLDQSRGLMGYGGESEAGRRLRMMVRGYFRYCHPSYLTTFCFVFLSSAHRPPSSAGLEVGQQDGPLLMDEDTRVLPTSSNLFERIFESTLRGLKTQTLSQGDV